MHMNIHTWETPYKCIAGCPKIVKRGSKPFGSIPTDDIVDAYENDETNIGENEKVGDDSKMPLALLAPSWAELASKSTNC